MRREYDKIVFFWTCLHGMCDIIVDDFVKFSSDSKFVTRSSNGMSVTSKSQALKF